MICVQTDRTTTELAITTPAFLSLVALGLANVTGSWELSEAFDLVWAAAIVMLSVNLTLIAKRLGQIRAVQLMKWWWLM